MWVLGARGDGGGVAMLTDRWRTHHIEDYVGTCKGIFLWKSTSPRVRVEWGLPPCGTPGASDAPHSNPWSRRSRAKWSNGEIPVCWASLIWGRAGKVRSWNTRGIVTVFCLVCLLVSPCLRLFLLLLLCAWPVAMTHFTRLPCLIQTQFLFLFLSVPTSIDAYVNIYDRKEKSL